ncbi:hypothetical protein QJS66_05560 [Kocuria rhizophila]|nr:hypothetical protein QJS66_05560 [Kocuria rhizophila]
MDGLAAGRVHPGVQRLHADHAVAGGPPVREHGAGHVLEVRDPMDLSLVAAALVGSLIGLAWWRHAPPRSSWGRLGSWAWAPLAALRGAVPPSCCSC